MNLHNETLFALIPIQGVINIIHDYFTIVDLIDTYSSSTYTDATLAQRRYDLIRRDAFSYDALACQIIRGQRRIAFGNINELRTYPEYVRHVYITYMFVNPGLDKVVEQELSIGTHEGLKKLVKQLILRQCDAGVVMVSQILTHGYMELFDVLMQVYQLSPDDMDVLIPAQHRAMTLKAFEYMQPDVTVKALIVLSAYDYISWDEAVNSVTYKCRTELLMLQKLHCYIPAAIKAGWYSDCTAEELKGLDVVSDAHFEMVIECVSQETKNDLFMNLINSVGCVRKLLSRVDVNYLPEAAMTPLVAAITHQNFNVVRLLVQHGAHLDMESNGQDLVELSSSNPLIYRFLSAWLR